MQSLQEFYLNYYRMVENLQQSLQEENQRRREKDLQYNNWKARNSNASNKRKSKARWIYSMTSTVNSNYNEDLFRNI